MLIIDDQQVALLAVQDSRERLYFFQKYIFFPQRSCVNPTSFISSLGLDTSTQQDAQEFSKLFVCMLEERLSDQADARVRAMVQRQFRGGYEYVTRCCRYRKNRPRTCGLVRWNRFEFVLASSQVRHGIAVAVAVLRIGPESGRPQSGDVGRIAGRVLERGAAGGLGPILVLLLPHQAERHAQHPPAPSAARPQHPAAALRLRPVSPFTCPFRFSSFQGWARLNQIRLVFTRLG